MSVTFSVDYRQFNQAIAEYAAASGKDFASVVNRQTNNLAIHGLEMCDVAEAQAIASLESKEWWPKYVAKLLHARKANTAFNAFMRSKSPSAKRLVKASRYTVNQARIFSKKLIRKRLVAVKFMRFFFARMSQALAPYAEGKRKNSKKFNGFAVRVIPATAQNPTCFASTSYEYKKRSAKTAAKAERKLQAWLNEAIPVTVADMRRYIERKMSETARRYSAK